MSLSAAFDLLTGAFNEQNAMPKKNGLKIIDSQGVIN